MTKSEEQTAELLELIAENPGIEAAELNVRTSWDWEADDAITVADLEKAGKAVCKNYGWHIGTLQAFSPE